MVVTTDGKVTINVKFCATGPGVLHSDILSPSQQQDGPISANVGGSVSIPPPSGDVPWLSKKVRATAALNRVGSVITSC